MATDPVCKMNVDPKTAKAKSNYDGQTYYFCAPECKKVFEQNPQKFLGTASGGTRRGCCGC